MPIFRINDQLHYFAHVPKCGGSSVETYLTERFGRLALHEPGRHLIPEKERWNRSSGEHIPVVALDRIIPPDWLVSSFAVVRHPVRRLISAFTFNRDRIRIIPTATDFNVWFAEASAWIRTERYRYGSHLAPQTTFVPEGARIFRLEDGLEQILPYLDALAGNSDGPREIPARNVGVWRDAGQAPVPSEATLARIAEVYAEDFDRFGYDRPATVAAAEALPDLPALPATGKPPAPAPLGFRRRLLRKLIALAEGR